MTTLKKVTSWLLPERLQYLLPRLISQNQSGFVNGGSVAENVLLAYEIITDIRKRGKPNDVLIKLDMAKNNDRVNFKSKLVFLSQIALMSQLVIRYWELWWIAGILFLCIDTLIVYSIKQGRVKQVDPLSPALFLLSVEVLSTTTNHLSHNNAFWVLECLNGVTS